MLNFNFIFVFFRYGGGGSDQERSDQFVVHGPAPHVQSSYDGGPPKYDDRGYYIGGQGGGGGPAGGGGPGGKGFFPRGPGRGDTGQFGHDGGARDGQFRNDPNYDPNHADTRRQKTERSRYFISSKKLDRAAQKKLDRAYRGDTPRSNFPRSLLLPGAPPQHPLKQHPHTSDATLPMEDDIR